MGLITLLYITSLLLGCTIYLSKAYNFPLKSIRLHKMSTIRVDVSLGAVPKGEDPAADEIQKREDEKQRIFEQKRAEYEAKMLDSAMGVTKNQEKFFSIGKFLIPLVLATWAYAFYSGQAGF